MKIYHFFIYSIFGSLCLSACKKNTAIPSKVAALNIVDAYSNIPQAAVNFSAGGFPYYREQTFVFYENSAEFGLQAGANVVSLVSPQDTSGTLFRGTFNLQNGGIYSLYIAGTAAKPDTVFMQDHIPYYGADSVAGARFINLSSDNRPLNITLQGVAGNQVSSLSYKRITPFKKYSAISNILNNGGYIFNVTDASGNMLTTFNWLPTTFKNNTLVISGSVSDGSISVFPVNNY